jgi:uncharacterized protein YuzB (UPF0349 family)
MMVKICPNCSNVDESRVHEIMGLEEVESTCIGECGQHEGKSFGFVNDELIIKDSEEEFYTILKNFKRGH